MTAEYIKWRNAIEGIEDAYSDLRYNRPGVPRLLIRCVCALAYLTYHSIKLRHNRDDETRKFRHLAAVSRYEYRAKQYWRQAVSADLRSHTRLSTYL